MLRKTLQWWRGQHVNSWIIFFVLIYFVLALKVFTMEELDGNWFFGMYSVLVSLYLLSRFVLSYFYEPPTIKFDEGYEPTVSFGVPAKNEGENIRETILRIARSDYPKDKFDIIAVNDGSDDNTLQEMRAAKRIAAKEGIEVKVIDWKKNKGKRCGMAECVIQSDRDIIIFIDSDSFVEKDTTRQFVKYFIDGRIAAVAGHAYVANAEQNILTKMQAIRYYISFTVNKAAEAIFGSDAIAHTFVPDTLNKFLKQQLRWKKSWVRESLLACTFMWKRNPIMSVSFYLGVALPLLSPIVAARALLWMPLIRGRTPLFYIFGLGLMMLVSGIYYYARTGDRKWFYGVFSSTFYAILLVWQLPYAILNLRDSRWGTR